jgi:hypothetical protein
MAELDIDSDASPDEEIMSEEDMDQPIDDTSASRAKIWGLCASPGGGCSVALVTWHSASVDRPARHNIFWDRSYVMFDLVPMEEEDVINPNSHSLTGLTTEGRMWEWMYGGGAPVPGIMSVDDINDEPTQQHLRHLFEDLASKEQCVICGAPIASRQGVRRCTGESSHDFGTLLSSISTYCHLAAIADSYV